MIEMRINSRFFSIESNECKLDLFSMHKLWWSI